MFCSTAVDALKDPLGFRNLNFGLGLRFGGQQWRGRTLEGMNMVGTVDNGDRIFEFYREAFQVTLSNF